MKITKYITFFLFTFLVSCKETNNIQTVNNQFVKLLWRNEKFDWMPSSLISDDNQLYFADLKKNFYSVNIENAKIGFSIFTE